MVGSLPGGSPAWRRWEELERRGRALLAEASCKAAEGQSIDASWLNSGCRWLAGAAEGGWAALVGPLPGQRSYRRIVASPHLEAWLIFWPYGGRLQLHDHGGASGALTVVCGTLDEEYLLDGCVSLRRRRIAARASMGFDGAYVHDVCNTGAEPATSVHVYSSATRQMAFYDLADGRLRALPGALDGASIIEQDFRRDITDEAVGV
jgi:hypothetical protein